MPAQPPDFTLTLDVRDYECDLQGIVNNAIYQHYLEHARHQYLQSLGLSFARFHEQGHDLVLTRAEIDYKTPLRSGDRFTVESGKAACAFALSKISSEKPTAHTCCTAASSAPASTATGSAAFRLR